jgi:acetyl-CoA carboxylase biotin carboxyl carrier protein
VSLASQVALVRRRDGGALELCAPCPGVVRRVAAAGARVTAGERFAELEILGRRVALVAPEAPTPIDGVIDELLAAPGVAVSAGDVLAVLGELGGRAGARATTTTAAASASAGLVLRAPSSGRFYRRAAPDKPPLVEDGAEVASGQAIGLLEVMKTFSRIHYGGPGLPDRAFVVRVVPADGADVEAGDVLLELGDRL